MTRFLAALLLALLGAARADSAASQPPKPLADRSPHSARMIVVGGTQLQLLDWGGAGDAIVLVHGSGNSPHLYDELAPLVRAKTGHRVIAPTRRGHGRSQTPNGSITIDTLADDLRAVLDSAGIQRAWLLGYSYGGNDISRFAERWPERVRGLIYLDATTDYTDSTVLAAYERMPGGAPPSVDERSNYDAYVRWLRRTQIPDVPWGATQDVMTRDELEIASDGALRPRAGDVMAPMSTIALSYRRPYALFRMPALFIYAQYRVAPNTFAGDTALTRALHSWEANDFGLRQRATRARIANALPAARAVTVPGAAHTSLPFIGRDIIVREVVRLVMSSRAAPPRRR